MMKMKMLLSEIESRLCQRSLMTLVMIEESVDVGREGRREEADSGKLGEEEAFGVRAGCASRLSLNSFRKGWDRLGLVRVFC